MAPGAYISALAAQYAPQPYTTTADAYATTFAAGAPMPYTTSFDLLPPLPLTSAGATGADELVAADSLAALTEEDMSHLVAATDTLLNDISSAMSPASLSAAALYYA